jgi:hypothetical protein
LNIAFAITASAFAAIYLCSIIVFGGEIARNIAIGAAFLGCASQYCGPDPASYKTSIYLAYAAFVAGIFAYIALLMGN